MTYYMQNLLRRGFNVVVAVIACLSVLSACKAEDEVYDFVFDIQGSIVTELGTTIEVPFTYRNITSVSVSDIPSGWEVKNIDMIASTVTLSAPDKYTSENSKIEENGILHLVGKTAAGTSVAAKSYLSLLNQSVDLTSEWSNCYALWQKDTRYTIDVTHKGESQETIAPEKVDLLWQSEKDIIQYFSFDKSAGTFTFFIGNEEVKDDNEEVVGTRIPDGNAVIAAYDSAGNIIWSWHIWATGSDIESNVVTSSAGVVFMDRNLGAYHNPNGSTDGDDIFKGYGMYYQWGRKDPFNRPYDYAFSNNDDKAGYDAEGGLVRFKYADAERYADAGTMEFAIANPTIFVRGSKDNAYDWLYEEHDDELWSESAKSVQDPCPKGWRVAKAEAYSTFDIAEAEDAMTSAEMRGRYGWTLVDGSVQMFMPAAGRKSFETGVFTNMSNYGGDNPPLPWIGCYWTAGVGVSDAAMAGALFFDLNTTRAVNNRYEPRREMHRANAMQVRCVRE